MGLFNVFDGISASVDDFVDGENSADEDKVFGWSDKCGVLANGDQRFGVSTGEVAAK